MKSVAYRSILLSVIMVTSSLAGCIADEVNDSDENEVVDPIPVFGSVMVSTYHVGELVKAVAGDHVVMEYMSQDNIPVHDYEPSATDLIRLQEADIFFYHGLNLEPWVESTLSSLGSDAPPSFMTHTMPSGEITLDYESMLVADLCELMNDGPFESTTLGMLTDDHDDHDDHSDDEDDHSDDEDDHDDHEGHEHSEAERIIQNPEACPADTSIQVFHMEEGEHVVEFESEHHEDFNMAVLKMLGGHAHHHHDHGDHDDHSDDEDDHDDHSDDEDDHDDHSDDEDDHDDHDDHSDDEDDHDEMCHNTDTHENYESTEEECEAAGHMWTGDDDHDDHGDEMCHNTDTHENYESTEEDCEAAGHVWMGHEDHDLPEIHADRVAHTLSFPEDDHDDHDDEDITPEHAWDMGYAVIHIEVEGDYGFALPNDVQFYVMMGEGGHSDHDDHDDHSDDEDDHDEDDHDDHSDDEDDHEGEIEADEDEAFDYDPHSWLDPLAFKEQVNLVLEKLTMTFPDGTEVFAANAEGYSSQITLLNDRFEEAFGEQGTCVTGGHDKTIVANHNAYSYISVRYDIDIMTVHGLDPEGEPSPAEVAEVVEHIKEEGITVLFVEEYTDQTAVQSIVDETGVEVQILYTMEMRPSDSEDDYMSMMNKNLVNLVSGIGC